MLPSCVDKLIIECNIARLSSGVVLITFVWPHASRQRPVSITAVSARPTRLPRLDRSDANGRHSRREPRAGLRADGRDRFLSACRPNCIRLPAAPRDVNIITCSLSAAKTDRLSVETIQQSANTTALIASHCRQLLAQQLPSHAG